MKTHCPYIKKGDNRQGTRLSDKRTGGSLLIISLWAISFFGMMAVALAVKTQSQVGFVKRFKEDAELRMSAYSGLSYVLDYLRKTAAADPNQKSASAAPAEDFVSRFRQIEFGDALRKKFSIGYYVSTKNPGGQGGDTTALDFGFQDEETKININTAPENALARIYTFGADLSEDEAKELAHQTLLWRQRKEEFREFGHALGPAGAGFGSVEELLMVPRMKPDAWIKLRDHLTVYGSGKVNLNTAPGETLRLLGISSSLVQKITEYRKTELVKKDTKTDPSDPKFFTDLGDLTQKVGVLPQEYTELVNISSVWAFQSSTVHFLSLGDFGAEPRKAGLECVASRKGQILFLRDL